MMIVQKLYFYKIKGLKNVFNFMGLICKYNVVGNCVLCLSGEDDGLLGLTFIFAKVAQIVTLFSLAYWLLLLIIYHDLSCFIIINLNK